MAIIVSIFKMLTFITFSNYTFYLFIVNCAKDLIQIGPSLLSFIFGFSRSKVHDIRISMNEICKRSDFLRRISSRSLPQYKYSIHINIVFNYERVMKLFFLRELEAMKFGILL